MKVYLQIGVFPLTCFSLGTFTRNLVQFFRSDRCIHVRDIFFYRFYTFKVTTHIVAEDFRNNYLATLLRYNSWI